MIRFEPLCISADLSVSSLEAALDQLGVKTEWKLHVPPSLHDTGADVLIHVRGGKRIHVERIATDEQGRRWWFVEADDGRRVGSFEV